MKWHLLPLTALLSLAVGCAYRGATEPIGTSFEFQQRMELEKQARQACPKGFEIERRAYRCLDPGAGDDSG